jgi:putative oxidoreductase
VLAHLLRIGLGLFFLVVAVLKLAERGEFERAVGDFGIVPDGLVGTTAVVLIALEGLAGVLLVAHTRAGLALAAALLVLFLGVLAYGLALGLDIDCGCLGLGAPPAAGGDLSTALVRDLVLLALVGAIHALERRRERREGLDRAPSGGGESRP